MGSAHQLSFGETTPSGYARRDPEKTLLHEVIRQHWQTFAARASDQGKELPLYVQKEFDVFLGCDSLAHADAQCDFCPSSDPDSGARTAKKRPNLSS